MGESTGFNLLHRDVQRWIWEQNWSQLRDIQERAIQPIIEANRDVIISASTAAGKTEAAFLPACSRIAEMKPDGIGILYISPLKALINDQYRRLLSLGEALDLPVTPWHGDVLGSVKGKQKKQPGGIVLITPESLESLLLSNGAWCAKAFSSLSHIIIDEFHVFLGTERGCQLQSLLHRIEFLLGRTVPRVALSATLGDMEQVARFLRPPAQNYSCEIIESKAAGTKLKIQLRGYLNKASQDQQESPTTFEEIVNDLYRILRGKSHLIFTNSRERTEQFCVGLSDLCKKNGVPNEFFPHHGNLSKEMREELEARLQKESLPTSAVCTMTLELGIDIGSVDSIAQVTAPQSVASLRQRLGRSGRRGDAAILRLFISEDEITAESHPLESLRVQTAQSIAMINLLLQRWCEPASDNQYHLSTLVQQTLAVIGQYGGVRASQLWTLLCKTGPFALVDKGMYAALLRALGEHHLITQMGEGPLVLGVQGEKLVEHYSFFTAFNALEEYRLEFGGSVIGTIPLDKPLAVGQTLIFGGHSWQVEDINPDEKYIQLGRGIGGVPPKFTGGEQAVHDVVRQEMRRIYIDNELPVYLNKSAKEALAEGFDYFHRSGLERTSLIEIGSTLHVLPWLGDRTTNTITALLRGTGLEANCFSGIIDIKNCTLATFATSIQTILAKPPPSPEALASKVLTTIVDKHDPYIPVKLRNINYGRRHFDVEGAVRWLADEMARLTPN